jgi:AcrR family transcriptional regulator
MPHGIRNIQGYLQMSSSNIASHRHAHIQAKDALLEAVKKLVAERGLNAISISDIAAAAGFTRGVFYLNFESLEAMLLELLLRLEAEQDSKLHDLESHAPKDIPQAIDYLAELAVQHATCRVAPVLTAEIQLQAHFNPDTRQLIEACMATRMNAIANWIDHLKKTHAVTTGISSVQMAQTVLALAQSFALQSIEPWEIRSMMKKVLERLFQQAIYVDTRAS